MKDDFSFVVVCVIVMILLACFCRAAFACDFLPEWESDIIKEVAQEYRLNEEETKLLYVIRKVENGRQGREFGVLTPEAMRYEKGCPIMSFTTQAKWAAGTIRKRYNGNLEVFAARWCPLDDVDDVRGLNVNWLKNARFWLSRCI